MDADCPRMTRSMLAARARTVTWGSVDTEDEIPAEPLDARLPAQRHGGPELGAQDVQGVRHAVGGARRETPQRGASDRHHVGAPRERLEHVGPTREASV